MSPEIAERIASAERPIRAGEGELRVATVLFTDIEGFSTISEKVSPQTLSAMLNDYFTALSDVIVSHGGAIIHFQATPCWSGSIPWSGMPITPPTPCAPPSESGRFAKRGRSGPDSRSRPAAA
ncbi:MAG: adenylate/guanylate cyclase domain-containing protein [Acidimicrobiia bacterium]|nr:adenylate/guanylate cyclase domain-containing protein [Acidimicrobiia bacterium]